LIHHYKALQSGSVTDFICPDPDDLFERRQRAMTRHGYRLTPMEPLPDFERPMTTRSARLMPLTAEDVKPDVHHHQSSVSGQAILHHQPSTSGDHSTRVTRSSSAKETVVPPEHGKRHRQRTRSPSSSSSSSPERAVNVHLRRVVFRPEIPPAVAAALMAEPEPPSPALFEKGKGKGKNSPVVVSRPEVIGTIVKVQSAEAAVVPVVDVPRTTTAVVSTTLTYGPGEQETSTPVDVSLMAGTSFDTEVDRLLMFTPVLPVAAERAPPMFPLDLSAELQLFADAPPPSSTVMQATACSAYSMGTTTPTAADTMTSAISSFPPLPAQNYRNVIDQFNSWIRLRDVRSYQQWLETFPSAPCQFCVAVRQHPCRECVNRSVQYQLSRQD
jgi:hypothetical protein